MLRQGELVQEIARQLPERVPGEWVSLRLEVSALAPYLEDLIYATRPDGSVTQELAPRTVPKLLRELREVMYRPEAGTWFSMALTLSRQGERADLDVSFDYEAEPAWANPAVSVFYAQDVKKFPRAEAKIPGWLQEHLERAKVEYPEESE